MFDIDSETCGFHGPMVLLQWAEDEGPIHLHEVWRTPVWETLALIEQIVDSNYVCGFNLVFDWFHLCKTYTTLKLLAERYGKDIEPQIYIQEYADLEAEARFGPCLKPKGALDLMLHARKGPYQSTMQRKPLRIKKVPRRIGWLLAEELDKRIPLKDIYFAKYADPSRRWRVADRPEDGTDDFVDVVLKFNPSSALKALAVDALGLDPIRFKDIMVDDYFNPKEKGYAPFYPHSNWPDVILAHINHWAFNHRARQYAEDDVDITRRLRHHFTDAVVSDVDSILACMVGAVRWRGYSINVDGFKKLRSDAQTIINGAKFNFTNHAVCRKYMEAVLSDVEIMAMSVNDKITTKGPILELISKWKDSEVCDDCHGDGCAGCTDGFIDSDKPHLAATRAREILDLRHAKKKIEIYDKLIDVGRFHTDLSIIGTKSSRMAGQGGLSAHGINRETVIRQQFTLADRELDCLTGGDFAGFEVVLMDAAYKDPKLHEELVSGRKIHAIWGSRYFFPKLTYEEIIGTKGKPGEEDLYGRSKNGVFAVAYFGEDYTLTNRVGIPAEIAKDAYEGILRDYPKLTKEREFVTKMFCSMQQPKGLGTAVEWHEPQDYIESMFGFRRYFTLENQICKALYTLANAPPKSWKQMSGRVVRRDREQTTGGAAQTALYAAAFAIQGANMRAAGNHVIQSPGAELTKELQHDLWTIQPVGIKPWEIQPINIHDEVLAPTRSANKPRVKKIVGDFITKHQKRIPLIEIEWSNDLKNWADK